MFFFSGGRKALSINAEFNHFSEVQGDLASLLVACQSVEEDVVLCLPTTLTKLSRADVLRLILIKDVYENNQYMTFGGEKVFLMGSTLLKSGECLQIRSVRKVDLSTVLDESYLSSFPTDKLLQIQVFDVSHCFSSSSTEKDTSYGKSISIADILPDEIGLSQLNEHILYIEDTIHSSDTKDIFRRLDEFIKSINMYGVTEGENAFANISPSLSMVLYSNWRRIRDEFLSQQREQSQRRRIDKNKHTPYSTTTQRLLNESEEYREVRMGQIVESYIMKTLGRRVLRFIYSGSTSSSADKAMMELLNVMRKCSQSDLGVRLEIQVPQYEAIEELSTLSKKVLPTDKLIILQNVVNKLKEAIRHKLQLYHDTQEIEVSIDGLIPILMFIIIQAALVYDKIPQDIRYISEYHFVTSPVSNIELIFCHYQTALSRFGDILKRHYPLFARSTEFSYVSTRDDELEDIESGTLSSYNHHKHVPETKEGEKKEDIIHTILPYIDENGKETDTDNGSVSSGEEESSTSYIYDIKDGDGETIFHGMPKNDGLYREKVLTEFSIIHRSRQKICDDMQRFVENIEIDDELSITHSSSYTLNTNQQNIGFSQLNRMGINEIKSLCSKKEFNALVNQDGQVYTWGTCKNGRLGRSLSTEFDLCSSVEMPTLVKDTGPFAQENIAQLSLGDSHVLCCTESGKVFGWGDNRCLQLGIDVYDNVNVEKFSIYSQISRLYELKSMGCCGSPILIPIKIHVKMVACGSYHSLCLSDNGKVYAWGRVANGRLGISLDHSKVNTTPHLKMKPEEVIINKRKFYQVSHICAGTSHSVALLNSGEVYTWGVGMYGRLGHGDNSDQYTPSLIKTLADAKIKIKSVATATTHTMLLSNYGRVYGCGLNDHGQVGCDDTTATSIRVLAPLPLSKDILPLHERVLSVTCGEKSTILLTNATQDNIIGLGDMNHIEITKGATGLLLCSDGDGAYVYHHKGEDRSNEQKE